MNALAVRDLNLKFIQIILSVSLQKSLDNNDQQVICTLQSFWKLVTTVMPMRYASQAAKK